MNYRKLNSVTKKDARPLPMADDVLDALQGYDLFTTQDLRSGYWQLSVSPEDRGKAAFVTPTGSWEFLRVPFGFLGPLHHLIVQCKLLCRAAITIVAFVILMILSYYLKESKNIVNVLRRF